MFGYRKRLIFPIKIEEPDPVFAQVLSEHYAGKDSEFSAAVQYLNHRSNMRNHHLRELLGLIAAEELGHMELIAACVNKLGGAPVGYLDAQGSPWELKVIDQSSDPIAMLQADIEAEVRSQTIYQKHIELTNAPGLQRMLNFLISREEVHNKLMQKAYRNLTQGGDPEQFPELIYEYKMSLQVLE